MGRRTRILHTADWHLGHTLLGHGRDYEHARFLSWLVEQVVAQDVDVVIVAGDVFDGRSPSGPVQGAYFGFLASLRKHAPQAHVVVVAGNHDSPSRLASSKSVLGMLGVHVIGAAAPGGSPSDLALALSTHRGQKVGIAAVPFLRPSDLRVGDGLEPARIAAAMASLYRGAADAAREMAGPGAPLIATGHAHLKGAALSPRSERLLFGGEAGAVSRDIFPAECAYVAMGHLHLSQDVGAQDAGDVGDVGDAGPRVRYSGSPIPLALVEAEYHHSVSLIELDGELLTTVKELPVPRFVAIQKIERASLEEALDALEALPAATDLDRREHPWLELHSSVEHGMRLGDARARVESALAGRAARLVRLVLASPELSGMEAEQAAPLGIDLAQHDVGEVVQRRWDEVRAIPLSEAHRRALDLAIARAQATVAEAQQKREADRLGSGELA